MKMNMIGKRIREERLILRLTQEQLAEKAGLNESYVGQIERGTKNPSLESLIKLSAALGVTIDFLLQDVLDLRKTELIRELSTVVATRNDDEIRLLINISRLVSNYMDKNNS